MTVAIAIVLAVAAVALLSLTVPPLLRSRRRARMMRTTLPDSLRCDVERNVPVTRTLPAPLLRRLEGLVVAFLAEKDFVGCNGLIVTDEIRSTIAAQACLLVLGRPGSLYDELHSVLVYPSTFWVEDEVHDENGLVTRRRRELSGEAWESHRIVLSWQDIVDTAARPADGYNVVLHEFAHYLESEGRGLAAAGRGMAQWHADLVEEYTALCGAVERGEETFLDPYAAEDESEFFAVASEEFVECPAELRDAHSRLYALLTQFYGIDPAAWPDELASAEPHADIVHGS